MSPIKGRITNSEKPEYIDCELAVKAWMESLHDIIYDADKVLDETKYRNIKEKFKQQNKLRSCLFNYKHVSIFEYIMIAKLDEMNNNLFALARWIILTILKW